MRKTGDFWTAFLHWLMWAVVAVSAVLNVAPFFASWRWLPADDPLSNLPAMAIGVAALMAIRTFRRDRDRIEHEATRARSAFFFDQCAKGLDEVLTLLGDCNNNRVIWIRAARTLLAAKNLATSIQDPQYAEAYRMHELRIRNDLYLALTLKDENNGDRQPLPPHFFFGLPGWRTDDRSLDEVSVEASPQGEVQTISINTNFRFHGNPQLSVKSVVAIFDFLQYPNDYEDPLNKVAEWDDHWDVMGGDQGARRYVAHRRTRLAAHGKVFSREDGHLEK